MGGLVLRNCFTVLGITLTVLRMRLEFQEMHLND